MFSLSFPKRGPPDLSGNAPMLPSAHPACIQIPRGQFVHASCDLPAAFSTSRGSFMCVSLHRPLDQVYTKVLTWALLSRETELAKPNGSWFQTKKSQGSPSIPSGVGVLEGYLHSLCL